MAALDKTFDIAVIGAGVFGAWTAHRLCETGSKVILVDQYGPANARSSSGGETRIMRRGYGPDEIYSRWADRSLGLWRDLSERSGQSLFHQTGVLWLARDQDSYSLSTLATFARLGIGFERLTRDDLEHAYPQIRFGPISWGIFEHQGGVLMARKAVRAVVNEAERNGVTYLEDAVLRPAGDGTLTSLTTMSNGKIRAEVFVFACGPWLPKVFPALLGNLIRVTRQEVFYFQTPAGDLNFSAPAMPVWIDFNDLVYAIPKVEERGFKIAIDAHGSEFDPDIGDRALTDEGLKAVRSYLARRVPGLEDAPLAEGEVCQYENTSNGDFLIDRHPSWSNVWLLGGGSGHGFKHGPAVGEYAASLVSGAVEIESRFTLSTKKVTHRRRVY